MEDEAKITIIDSKDLAMPQPEKLKKLVTAQGEKSEEELDAARKEPLIKCKYHYRCKKSEDPEHKNTYVCFYTKPCLGGTKCEKLEDPEHVRFFTHDEDITVESKIKHKKVKKPKVEKEKEKEKEPVKYTITFKCNGVGKELSIDASGFYTALFDENMNKNAIDKIVHKTLMKRHFSHNIFNTTNIDYTVKISCDE